MHLDLPAKARAILYDNIEHLCMTIIRRIFIMAHPSQDISESDAFLGHMALMCGPKSRFLVVMREATRDQPAEGAAPAQRIPIIVALVIGSRNSSLSLMNNLIRTHYFFQIYMHQDQTHLI